ncbi:MAG: hypothetical protein JXA97_05865 [Anaerolineales bacterium]|nr:hypothetical protein [Anaerolineales bacterium]
MRLLVLTPEAILLEAEDVTHVRAALSDGGSIGIRPRHHPLLADTLDGELGYTLNGERHALAVRAGILRVEPEQITLYTSGQIDVLHASPPRTATRLENLTRELEEQLEEGF